MQEKIGEWPHLNLYSTKEYKKIRLKYFTKELDEWWQNGQPSASKRTVTSNANY